jgi:hypothetical protein
MPELAFNVQREPQTRPLDERTSHMRWAAWPQTKSKYTTQGEGKEIRRRANDRFTATRGEDSMRGRLMMEMIAEDHDRIFQSTLRGSGMPGITGRKAVTIGGSKLAHRSQAPKDLLSP